MTSTYFQIKYRKKSDPVPNWYVKCTCKTKIEADRFADILSQVSDIYTELKVEPITVEIST